MQNKWAKTQLYDHKPLWPPLLTCGCPGEDGKLSMRGKGGFFAGDPEEKATDLWTIGIATTNLPRRHNKRGQLRRHLGLGTGLRRAMSIKNITMAATLCHLEPVLPGCCCLRARSFFYNISAFPHRLPLFIQAHYFFFMAIMTITIDATFPVIGGHFS